MGEKTIEKGCRVQVHYTGTLADGTMFDSSREREPLSFEVGTHSVIDGFEEALLGKTVGETVTVTIPPEKAYGAYDPNQVFAVTKSQVPESIPLEIGTKLQLSSEKGVLFVQITDVTDEEVILDGNHELAGQPLTFEIEVMDVQ